MGRTDQAEQLVSELISRKLAACVQIDAPIISHYQWQGQLHRDEEIRLTIKTSRDVATTLMQTLRELHPYDQPQIVMVQSTHVDAGYAAWVRESTV
ncbi:Divalent-cation tolerance protein CutA [Stieleria varia]|uniref:Divalent-cation tolerance protein CutA n=1 Tax=Stieleria varia TaxID=2528005 RepID=A0A5C6B7Z0_9BACT|nr:Divalent-cation tolerance protein CutA [Stieleria varia]